MSKDNIKAIEEIDELFWRKCFSVCRSVPKESLYISSGKLPLKYMIMKKRLMYWFHLCHRPDEELIVRVYRAQTLSVHKTDWFSQLSSDLKELSIDLSDKDVKEMTKYNFKRIIEDKILTHATNRLIKLKDSHSKSRFLPYFNGKPDQYLLSKNLTKTEKVNLFKIKT